jgi:hypothetical protein
LTDITEKLGAVVELVTSELVLACDWLADRGFVLKAPVAVGTTPKSKALFDEPAYLFENTEVIN